MPSPVNFFRELIEKGEREYPERTIFDDASTRIGYGDLAREIRIFREILPITDDVFVADALPHTVAKGCLISACIAMKVPGFSIDAKDPASYFLNDLARFRPSHLIVTEDQWRSLAPTLQDRVASVARPGIFNGAVWLTLTGGATPPADLAWMLLTSGSTGERKGVRITGESLRARTESEIADFGIGARDRLLGILSFAHDLGLNQLLTAVAAGAELRLRRPKFARDLLALLVAGDFDGLTATPVVWQRLLSLKTVGELPSVLSGPRFLTVSGGALSQIEFESLRTLFPHARWIRTYGQTETFRSLIAYDGEGFRPVAGARVRLDPQGQLIHGGATAMPGYFGSSEPTDGEISTGDYFRIEDGYYVFEGRRDDIVKRSDYRLSLKELENELRRFEKVAEASVVQGPRAKIGAVVVPSRGMTLTNEEVRIWAAQHLPFYMSPDRIAVRGDLPLTGAFKIDKQKLREELGFLDG